MHTIRPTNTIRGEPTGSWQVIFDGGADDYVPPVICIVAGPLQAAHIASWLNGGDGTLAKMYFASAMNQPKESK